jgi:4'-phosphopantetheinyl transferase
MNPDLTPWEKPSAAELSLSEGVVALWRFRLDPPETVVVLLHTWLNREERLRAGRLLDPLKRRKFIVARGRLRQILSRYLDTQPAEVEFVYGEHGKPRLADACCRKLTFNLAHSGTWGLLAVAAGHAVGVDLEGIDQRLEYEKIADRMFSTAENACLEQCPSAQRKRLFFRIWTRKEALLKGFGLGLSSGSPAGHEADWLIRSFPVGRGYVGAVAVAGKIIRVQRWHLP